MNTVDHTEIIDKIQQHIEIESYNNNFIISIVRARIQELNFNDTADYILQLESNKSEVELLKTKLTNSYSMFFRNRLTFEVLNHIVLPNIFNKLDSGAEIRIWSAGCAAGHEAYSLAILFETFNRISSIQLKYRIFATDINYNEIEKAVLGEYNAADLGNLTLAEIKKWFVNQNKKYKIHASVKKFVQFELFDLLNKDCICPKTSIFGDFQIIMCANVLIYYNKDVQKRILSNFKQCISENGIIITGETERELFLQNDFFELYPQSAIFISK